MASTVDLFNYAKTTNEEGSVWSREAATFVEVLDTPRVLADSQKYLVYNMTKSRLLRVVQRADILKGTVRAHTRPIHSVKFVNYRSNVAASASEGEFFVWFVTDESKGVVQKKDAEARLTVRVYFKLQDPVTIPCFSFFINAENKRPDCLILYDTRAAILEGSSLIQAFEASPLEATLQRNSKTLRTLNTPVGTDSLCSVGSGGWFAFTTDPTMVAACTLQNRNTPSWACCEGEEVRALHLLDTPAEENATVLVAASTNAVFQWVLTGVAEPSLLRKFVIDGSIVAMESSRETFAVFDDKKQLVLVSMQSPRKFECTFFAMPNQVQRRAVCFNRAGEGSCVLADVSSHLIMFQLKSRSKSGGGPAAPSSSSPPKMRATVAAPAKKAAEPRVDKKVVANLMNALRMKASQVTVADTRAPTTAVANINTVNTTARAAAATVQTASPGGPLQRSGSYGHVSRPATAGLGAAAIDVAATPQAPAVEAMAALHASPATTAAARPALHNASLPQAPTDGVLAAVVFQSEDEVRQALQRLESVMTNTSQILQLVPETIFRDHKLLLNLSLEAQITELQQTFSTPQSQRQSTSPSEFVAFGESLIETVMDLISEIISDGVTSGVREATLSHLDHEVKNVLGNWVAEMQKQVVKGSLNDVIRENTAQSVSQVKQIAENFVKRELAEVLGNINGLFATLMKENAALRKALNDITSSGIVREIQSMQEEVRTLREAVRSQESLLLQSTRQAATHAPQSPPPTPEMLLKTALSLLQEQRQYRQGLEYIFGANQSPLLLCFFTTLIKENSAAYVELVEDKATSNDLWCDVLLQLVEVAVEEGEKEVVVCVASDILAEREQLVQSSARGAQLVAAMRTLAREAKGGTSNVSFLRSLKKLEKLLL